jgi:integrase
MPKVKFDGIKKRCDCARRRWSDCPHPWHFSFHHGGREHRLSLDVVARSRGQLPPASKVEALQWRDALRTEIRAGKFVEPSTLPPAPEQADTRLTLGDVCDNYVTRHVMTPTRRSAAQQAMKWVLGLIRSTEVPAANGTSVRLDAKPVDAVTKADIEAFRDTRRVVLEKAKTVLVDAVRLEQQADQATDKAVRRALRRQARELRRAAKCRPGAKGGEVGINRMLARLRHVFSWAIEEGYVTDTPFKRGTVTVVRLQTRAETARTRRLEVGEEERLLAHAGPHLRALIVAGLSTGCRLGELLGLQWHQIRRDDKDVARWIRLDAAHTKTNESRDIPVGPRLRAELDMRRHGPDGKELPLSAHVFGNEVGEEIASIKAAWRATCRRAGIRNLHYHDLRREFGCRLLESGASQHDVRDFLGHANITTTSRYLKSTPGRLEKALERMENPSSGRDPNVTEAVLEVDCDPAGRAELRH